MQVYYKGEKVPKWRLMLRLSDGKTIKETMRGMPTEDKKKPNVKPRRPLYEELEPRIL